MLSPTAAKETFLNLSPAAPTAPGGSFCSKLQPQGKAVLPRGIWGKWSFALVKIITKISFALLRKCIHTHQLVPAAVIFLVLSTCLLLLVSHRVATSAQGSAHKCLWQDGSQSGIWGCSVWGFCFHPPAALAQSGTVLAASQPSKQSQTQSILAAFPSPVLPRLLYWGPQRNKSSQRHGSVLLLLLSWSACSHQWLLAGKGLPPTGTAWEICGTLELHPLWI